VGRARRDRNGVVISGVIIFGRVPSILDRVLNEFPGQGAAGAAADP
jgi:hypothetical protein